MMKKLSLFLIFSATIFASACLLAHLKAKAEPQPEPEPEPLRPSDK
jgi:hypothetical protein